MDIRAHVIKLNEQRLNVFNQLQAKLDETEGRERSEEENQVIARMDADIDRLDAEIREFVVRETREREAAELREAQNRVFGEPANNGRGTPDPDQFFRDFLRGAATGDPTAPRYIEVDLRGAMRERELLRQGASAEEIRALAWDTGSSASLVPTTLSRTLYEYMEASNALFRGPTTKVNTSTGEQLEFPKLASHAIATQVAAQGTTLAGTDPTFGKMTLNAYKYGELVKVYNEVLQDPVVDVAMFLGRDIGRALGRITATAFVTGSGSGAPNGLMTALGGSGTIATGGTLITPTVEKLIDLQYSVVDEYRMRPSCAWLMNDSTAGTIRKLRDGAGGTVGAFIWEPSLTNGIQNGQPDRLLGKPVYTDSNVAAQGSANKTIAFGDMSAFYIRHVGNPVIESDSSVGFDSDETHFRGKWRVDSDLIDSNAINVIRQSVS